jgi:hypothetical protein
MKLIITQFLRFILFIIAQTLVFNNLEIGFGVQIMVYPLFLMLLPFDTSIVVLLLLAFVMGISIDAISDTYGLHTSSLLLVAYLRPIIFGVFSPREGYDSIKESTIFEMGQRWFISVFGLLLLIHHFWFFILEMFKMSEFLFILQKTILSVPLSFLLCILLQIVFVTKPKER